MGRSDTALPFTARCRFSYFELRELLPLVNPTSLDAALSWIDEQVLHFEPSLFMDRFVTPAHDRMVRILLLRLFRAARQPRAADGLLLAPRELVAEFGLGMILIYAMAHTLYMVVPGYGPVRYLADRYQHPFPGILASMP